jgi:hypothetical protein
MSAVAPAVNVSSSVAAPALELARTGPSDFEIQAAEQKRWMLWFGTPALFAAIFVAAALGTADTWWIGLALGAIGVDIFVLVWLAMSSDTNGLIGESPHH